MGAITGMAVAGSTVAAVADFTVAAVSTEAAVADFMVVAVADIAKNRPIFPAGSSIRRDALTWAAL